MMLIMSLGHPFIEVISAMHCRSFKEHDSHKSPESPYMRLKENWWENNRNNIGDYVFEWMRILGCQCDWCGESMVDFVNVGIKRLVME